MRETTTDPDGYFGEEVAATYDDTPRLFAPEVIDPVVDLIAEGHGESCGGELEAGGLN